MRDRGNAQVCTSAVASLQTAAEGVAWVTELCQELRVPGLGGYGLTEADFPDLIEKSANSSSMQGNPVTLTYDELAEVLYRSL